METQTAKRTHEGDGKVRCRVTTSFEGWQSTRDRYTKANKPIPDDVKSIEHVVVIDYSGISRADLETRCAKGDVIKFQGVAKKHFKQPDDFRAFFEGEGSLVTVHYKNVGNQAALTTPEQQHREDKRAANSLSDEDLLAILAEREEAKGDDA